MSDWGQGAKNNDIGWGQGAVNNDIGWGSVHANSWAGDTEIVGTDGNAPINVVAPVISGTALVGQTLTSTTGTWTSDTGVIGYLYQWYRGATLISGATNSTYVLTFADGGFNITCRVAATDTDGTSAYVSSNSINLPLLLDTYTNAAAAYSLRKLITGYTGPAIRVRRASDNTETNIGFVNNELDIVTLETFCSGTNGFVTTWYDQSGNTRNATQITASNQPQIVINGTTIVQNGKPSILSSNKRLFNNSFTTNVPSTDFFVLKPNSFLSSSFECYYDGVGTINQRGYFGNSNSIPKIDIIFDGTSLNGNNSNFNQKIAFILRNGANSNYYYNSVLQASGNSGTNTSFVGISFGRDYNDSTPSNIYYQEFIRYNGNKSSNRTEIETNISKFYNIAL